MKITCQSCQAKYTIADEKVAGKTVKIRCKKCSATIVVQGDQGAADARAPAHTMDPGLVMGQGQGQDEDVATRVFGGDTSGGGSPASDEWTVNVSETDQRTMTTPQIVLEYQRGTLTNDTYVWKDGMGDWVPITEVAELMQLISGPAPHATPEPAMGLGGTLAMDQPVMSPFAAAARGAPAAAKKPGRAGAVDLFGSQAVASDPAMAGGAPGDRQVGERNENSVLFSLSALTGAETAARAQTERDVMAPARSAAPRNNGGRAAMDDIMNLGGGMSAPMLAPPPLLAPVVEAPPPPAPVSMGPPGGMGSYAPAMQMPMQQAPKSRAGLFIAIAIAVVGLGGIAAFVVTRPPATTASTEGTATSATTAGAPSGAAAEPTTSAAASASASASGAPAESAAASAAPAESGAPAASGAAQAAAATHGQGPGKGQPKDDKKDDKKADKKDDKKTAAAEPPPKEDKKDDKKAEPAGGGGDFDRAAAMSALGAASGGAKGCAKPDGPTGGGRVKVTFAPSGNVTSATIDGPPFAGTPVGGCVASMFRGAHVPPFAGSPVVVTKSFTIN